MEPIPHQVQISKSMDFTGTFLMAMPPMQVSFHQEKDYDAKYEVGKYYIAFVVFQTFREYMQKGAPNESACGKTNQAKKNLMQKITLDGKSKNTHQGYKAD
jgi:hypothetical protein